MKKVINILIFLLFPFTLFSQEIKANVMINYEKVKASNIQIFKTLEKSLEDYINNTKWTDKTLKLQERIRCSFGIIIDEQSGSNQFKATLSVQSMRPVFNSSYQSPVLNFQDKDFTFTYVEYDPIIFNERTFSGKNLVEVISFYVYVLLGYDADTFSLQGGNEYFAKAQAIADYSINQGFSGWSSFDGARNRGSLIAELQKPESNQIRMINYQYHRLGLDEITENEITAKTQIYNSLSQIKNYQGKFQYYPLDIFLNSKKEEIVNIFSGGEKNNMLNYSTLKQILNDISPVNNTEYWDKIKN